jgi:putative nucleotidyltransferase with HDIG domain
LAPPTPPAPVARAAGARLNAFFAVVCAVALVVTLLTGTFGQSPFADGSLGTMLVLMGLLLVSEATRQYVHSEVSTSTECVPVIAAGVLAGPLAVPIMHVLVTVGADVARGRLRVATAFNVAVLTLAGLSAVGVLAVAQDTQRLNDEWGFLAAGLVAGLVYYAVNATLISTAESIFEGRPAREIYRERFAWLPPHYGFYGVLAAGLVLADWAMGTLGIALFAMPTITMTMAVGQYLRKTGQLVEDLRTANRSLEGLLAENRGLLASLGVQHLETIRAFARAIDAKDSYTAGHTERVALYSVMLADALGLPPQSRREIEHGALLHDIGKIGVRDAILQKAGPLEAGEWAQMKRHPELACFILDGIDLPQTVWDMVRSHHENIDGTGYPDCLPGDLLSLPARIARVADAFDAMTSDRPYRAALSLAAARAELHRCAGVQFCPEVVAAMDELIERGRIVPIVMGHQEEDYAQTA